MFAFKEVQSFLNHEQCRLLTYFFEKQPKHCKVERDTQNIGFCVESSANPIFELLLDVARPAIEEIVGEPLVPTYSFVREYHEKSFLEKHTDRHSCVYTSTLTLAQFHSTSWPISFEYNNQTQSAENKTGDLLVIRGCEFPHWREALKEGRQIQLFLHYVPKRAEYAEYFYDGRGELPLSIKTANLINSDEPKPSYLELKARYFSFLGHLKEEISRQQQVSEV